MNITAFCCFNSLYGYNANGTTVKAFVRGLHKVELPCSSRVDPLHVLKAFENGADGVIIIACPESMCRMQKGSRHAAKRIDYIKQLMSESGLNPDRLMMFHPNIPSAGKLEDIVAEAKAVLEKMSELAAV